MAITYRLASSSMFNTPGLLRWAMNGYKFKKDRKALLNVFTSGYGDDEHSPDPEVFDLLLKGDIPFAVEPSDHGGTVVFTA